MSFPTTLSPWYVVQFLGDRDMTYYHEVEKGDPFTTMKATALLFLNIQSAARVAAAQQGAEIRVLVTRDEAKEFGRG